MGIHDREYYHRSPHGGGGSFQSFAHTAVGTIILLNVILWLGQLVTRHPLIQNSGVVTDFLVCSGDQIFGGFPQVWRLVFATFAHATVGPWHILWNMLLLYFFGRELERMYGRRDFWLFYLVAGALSTLAEVGVQYSLGNGNASVLGASGAVMGVVVLFTLFYPRHTILFMFVIPLPCWLLCAIMLAMDLMGAMNPAPNPGGSNIANLAHLAGALCGFLYWRFDLRWSEFWAPLLRLNRRRGRKPRRQRRHRSRDGPAEIVRMDGKPVRETPRPDPISERMDLLLQKISKDGMDSLTGEEREFMVENSGKYRST